MEIVTNQINGDRGSEHSFALRMLTAFSLVSALMLAMGSLAQAAEVTEIKECPYTIENVSQASYRLVVDCVLDKTGISINHAEDVELDLDGHSISRPGLGCDDVDKVGINVSHSSRVRVANGTLKKFFRGVLVSTSDHSDFTKLTLVENCRGIELSAPLSEPPSENNTVSYNDISRNIQDGVLVSGANNNHVTFNVIDQNGSPGAGVFLIGGGLGAERNVIAFNAISGNVGDGVFIAETAHKNIVTSNFITLTSTGVSTGGAGIRLQTNENGAPAPNNFIVRNIALDNKRFDLSDGNTDCDHNIWKDNTFLTRSPASCIH
jgi:hypothetical protein